MGTQAAHYQKHEYVWPLLRLAFLSQYMFVGTKLDDICKAFGPGVSMWLVTHKAHHVYYCHGYSFA